MEAKIANTRAILEKFGIEDMSVVGIYSGRGVMEKRVCGKAAELCVGSAGLGKLLDIKGHDVRPRLEIEVDGLWVGVVYEGVFFFEAAPNLYTALAWVVATGGGLYSAINIDLRKRTDRLLEIIKKHGVAMKTYEVPFQMALASILADSRCAVSRNYWQMFQYVEMQRAIWRVATRELGQYHLGPEFPTMWLR